MPGAASDREMVDVNGRNSPIVSTMVLLDLIPLTCIEDNLYEFDNS